MLARTKGKECGKEDGDFLSWANTSWNLRGGAKWTNVSVEELCRKDSGIQLFTTQVVERPDDCSELCPKLHTMGRMASVQTPELLEALRGVEKGQN